PDWAKFHLINYPDEAKFATVHAAIDKGSVLIRAAAGGATVVEEARPLAPAYNPNNPACGRNVIIPLGGAGASPEVVAITAVNDHASDGAATFRVAVGVSHLPESNQQQLVFESQVPKAQAAFVHIVFHRAG